RLLRACGERPRSYSAADERNEFAPSHSITSSARAKTLGGTSRPDAFAVLRLSTVSYRVGVCTGRSAGFSPLGEAVHIARGEAIEVRLDRSIRDQAAMADIVAHRIDGRQSMAGREPYDQFLMRVCRRARGHDHAAIRPACEFRDGIFDFARVAGIDRGHLDSERRRHTL